MGNRTASERAERRVKIEEMLLERVSYGVIVDEIITEFKVSKEQVRKDIDLIKEMWMRGISEEADELRAEDVALARLTATRALKAGEFSASVAAQRLHASLRATIPDKQKEIDRTLMDLAQAASLMIHGNTSGPEGQSDKLPPRNAEHFEVEEPDQIEPGTNLKVAPPVDNGGGAISI